MAVNVNPGVYYTGTYWNDLPAVRVHLNQRATDDTGTTWVTHVRNLRGKPFEKALFLNCGNGWVERDWLAEGAVKSAVGIDYSEKLLNEARASAVGLPIEYFKMDTNTAQFPGGGYDLVVNHAAGHHIARLDKVMRALCEMLPDDGWFVNWDYTGPHRNQYSWHQWAQAHRLNNQAPLALKSRMRYPDLASMISTDPTEAIHPELFEEVLNRYFTVTHNRTLGGWLAYLLLTSNENLLGQPAEVLDPWVDEVLRHDAKEADAGRTLFRYMIAQPNRTVFRDAGRLAKWSSDEERRETGADAADGQYYKQTFISDVRAIRQEGLDRELLRPALHHLSIRRLRGNRRSKDLLDSALRFWARHL